MFRRLTLALLALPLILSGGAAFAAETSTSMLTQESLRPGSRESLLGVGVQLGTFSGLSFEYWYTRVSTLNTSLTVTRGNTATTLTHVWMVQDIFRGDFRAIVPFAGAGALAVWANSSRDTTNFNYNGDRFAFSLQVPLGVQYLPAGRRYSVFAEAVPSYEIAPARVGFVNADVGARLFF